MTVIDCLSVVAALAVVAVPMLLAWWIVRRTGDTPVPPAHSAPPRDRKR